MDSKENTNGQLIISSIRPEGIDDGTILFLSWGCQSPVSDKQCCKLNARSYQKLVFFLQIRQDTFLSHLFHTTCKQFCRRVSKLMKLFSKSPREILALKGINGSWPALDRLARVPALIEYFHCCIYSSIKFLATGESQNSFIESPARKKMNEFFQTLFTSFSSLCRIVWKRYNTWHIYLVNLETKLKDEGGKI